MARALWRDQNKSEITEYSNGHYSWRPIVTQSSAEVLAKQEFLCINRNTWLSQKIGPNGIKKIQERND